MKLFMHSKIWAIIILLGVGEFLALIFIPVLGYSSDPKQPGFWKALISVVLNILFIYWAFWFFRTKRSDNKD